MMSASYVSSSIASVDEANRTQNKLSDRPGLNSHLQVTQLPLSPLEYRSCYAKLLTKHVQIIHGTLAEHKNKEKKYSDNNVHSKV